MPVSGIPITPPHYGSRAGIESLYGQFNADQNADIQSDGSATEIAARFESALDAADVEVNAVVQSELGLAAAFPTTSAIVTGQAAAFADAFAGQWLFRGRGEPPVGKTPFDAMVKERREALGNALAALYYAPSGGTGPSAETATYFPSARAGLLWPAYPYYP